MHCQVSNSYMIRKVEELHNRFIINTLGRLAQNVSLLVVFLLIPNFLFAQDTYTSAQTGNWGTASTWTGAAGTPGSNDTVIIQDGHTVSFASGGGESVYKITIEAGGVLDMQSRDFNVGGPLFVNGTVTTASSGGKDLAFDGDSLGGTGTIAVNTSGRYLDISNPTVIIPTAQLSIFGDINVQNGATVTNKGHIEVYGDLDGANAAGSIWTNDTDAEIEVSGLFMDTGILNASASGNSVTYILQGAQDVKTPSSSTYHKLVISGTGTKTIYNNLTINDDLSILSGTLDGNGNNLVVKGDWTNAGDFLESTGSVTFNGTSDQTIDNSSGEVYNNLTLNKSSGSLILSGDIQVSGTLTMTSGIINASPNTLTLGSGVGSTGTLTYTAGHINGFFERWIDATGTYSFPIGSETSKQTLTIAINVGLQGDGSLITKFYDTDGGSAGLPLFDNPDSVFNEFVEGYWGVEEANSFNLGPANNYDIDLDGNGFTSFTIDGSTRVLRRDDSGSDWLTDEGAHVSPTGSVARRTGLKTLPAEFALGDTTNCSRPVTSAITGLSEVCTGATGVSYVVTNDPANSYSWTITGGTVAQGGDTNSITVDWGSVGMANANVRVIESNSCSQGVPVDLPVTIHSIQPTSVTGRTSVAENTSGEPYSVTDMTDYSFTWNITGGTQASGGTTNSITVDWSSGGTGYVSVTAQKSGCSASPATQLEVNKYVIIESVQDGDWDDPTTWDCNCEPLATEHVRINNTHDVRLTTGGSGTEVTNFIIEAGGILNTNGRKMTVHGDFVLNGAVTDDGTFIMDQFGTSVDGVGTIGQGGGGYGLFFTSDIFFNSTAVISFASGDLRVGAGINVTNYGSVDITATAGDLIATNASSTFINEANATLKVGNDLFAGTDGILHASATGNTVSYHGTVAQDIKTPQSSYYHLKTEGSGIKDLPGNLDVNGDITNNGTSDLDATTANYSINLAGDWINLGGTFNERSATVTLDGTSDQNITGAETFYNLTFSNTSDLYINNNISISNTLSMSGGDFYAQGNKFTLGTGAGTPGTLTYTSGTVIGQFERWVTSTATPYLFPVGTATYYRPDTITFANLGVGSLITEFIASDPGSTGLPQGEGSVTVTNQYTEGYWSITPANSLTSTGYSIALTATNFTSYTIIPGTRVIKRISGGSWTLEGAHAAANDPYLYRNNLDQGIDVAGVHFGIGHVVCGGLSINRTLTHVSCNGGSDGAIDITMVGGTAPWTFAWDHGPTTEDVSSLSAANYTVTATDSEGCEIDSTWTITEPAVLNATVNSTGVTCTGGSDGSITISSPSGGGGSYNYSINGGVDWFASGSFTGLSASTYNVQIQDAAATACIIVLDAALVLTEPNDVTPPVAVCQDITVQLDGTGNVTITALDVDNGSTDNCGIASRSLDITDFTCTDIGDNTVTLTVYDASSNSDNCTATVTVEDNINPSVTAAADVAANTSDDGTGDCTVDIAITDAVFSDNCAGSTLAWVMTGATTGSGAGQVGTATFDIGTTTITYTVTDGSSNTAVDAMDVVVSDDENPTAVCQDITVQLDAAGNATILATDVDGGSTDNCGIASSNVVPNAFTCADIGANIVTLTVTDTDGNTDNCTATVTVEDNIAPTAICQDIIVQLDGTGNVSILASDVDNGSSDACGIATLSVSPSTFTCADLGANTVTLTVTDNNGNVSTCTATVTVEDNVAPTAVCQDITVQLDATGTVTIAGADVDGGSTDNCSVASLGVSPNTFNCGDVGANVVTLTVTDGSGNSSTCSATVTVEDNVAPTAICQDLVISLDGTGNASILASDVDNGSNDACGIASLTIDKSAFTCADIGANVVTLIYSLNYS